MSSIVVSGGQINPNAALAPGVVVIEQLTPGSVAGIATNLGGFTGTSNWGQIDAPTFVSGNTDYNNQLGDVLDETYNIGTAIQAATLQGQVGNYVCIRVTDGTETSAKAEILDAQTVPATGAILTALYSGTVGNTLQVTVTAGTVASAFNVSVGRPGYVAENYTNISSSGAGFWANFISAINNGQSGIRGPSELVMASVGDSVAATTVSNAGTLFTAIPTLSFTPVGDDPGSGAAGTALMKAQTATPSVSQSGSGSFAPNDTVTMAGGTGTNPVLTVNTTGVASATIAAGGTGGTPGTQTVTGTTGTGTKFTASVTVSGGGVITAIISITLAGSYTVNPTVLTAEPVTGAGLTGAQLNIKMGVATATVTTPGSLSVLSSSPVAQGSTSGSGTGFTAVLTYGVVGIAMSNRGSDYAVAPTISFTGGSGSGAVATASLVSVTAPSTTDNPYALTGATNGNDGVDGERLLGTNVAVPTGMYALINTNVSLFALVENDDDTTFEDQDAFAASIGAQGVAVGEPGQTVAAGVTVKSGASLTDNSMVYLLGDWVYYYDTVNTLTRMISPQGFYIGKMVNLSPEQSPLNKPMFGILATQKSLQKQIYSNQDEITMMQNGIDVISSPSPGGNYFSCTTGKACGLDPANNNVPVQRMANFIGLSIGKSGVIGAYIGQLQTPTARVKARGAINTFLRNLQNKQQIQAFGIILNATNNPNSRVVLGYMQAQVTVQLFSVIIVFLIDLVVGTTNIQSVTPAPTA